MLGRWCYLVERGATLLVYLVGDVLGPVGIDEGVPALLPVDVCRGDVSDHDGVAVAVQGVLQQPRV